MTKDSKQRGASALEASLAVVPVLLVCLLGIELVHAHQSKQLVSLALHEAGRQASVTSADPHQVERAFARALSPLFTPAGQHASPRARQEATIERYARLYALPLWQLELTEVQAGGAKSHGHRSVRLDLIYVHEPLHSWLRQVLRQSARWLKATPHGLSAKAQRQGLVAMRLSRRVMIHENEVKRTTRWSVENSAQKPEQTLDADRAPRLGLKALQQRPALNRMQIPLEAGQNSDPGAFSFSGETRVHLRTQTSSLGSFKQESGKQDLCGVLLCCAQ